jgi:hypothetical protein
MNISLLLLAAPMFVLPVTMTGQERAAPSATDSRTIAYVRIKANRIGINTDTIDVVTPHARSDTVASGIHWADHYRHTVIGGFFGALGGAAIGGAVGAWSDAHPTTDDVMFSAAALLGIYGAIGGLVLGLLIGVAWPVK